MHTHPLKNGYGVLRSVLEDAHEENGYSRSDLTVLSAQVDPYRLDTPSGHRDGNLRGCHHGVDEVELLGREHLGR